MREFLRYLVLVVALFRAFGVLFTTFAIPFYFVFLVITGRGSVMRRASRPSTAARRPRPPTDAFKPLQTPLEGRGKRAGAKRRAHASAEWNGPGFVAWQADPRSIPRTFLDAEEKDRIVAAVRRAEGDAAIEIRVHVERSFGTDLSHRLPQVLERLEMDGTNGQSTVLLYIALARRKIAIYADGGAASASRPPFWDEIGSQIAERFGQGEFCEGVCEAIERIGRELHRALPAAPGKLNRLPDDVSLGLPPAPQALQQPLSREGEPDPRTKNSQQGGED